MNELSAFKNRRARMKRVAIGLKIAAALLLAAAVYIQESYLVQLYSIIANQ